MDRRDEFPGPTEIDAATRGHHERLWERSPGEVDFLSLRVGLGRVIGRSRAVIRPGGADSSRLKAEETLSAETWIDDAPLAFSLIEMGTVGVVGDPSAATDLVRWLLLQVSALHTPAHVAVAAALPEHAQEDWSWLKWLPHARQSVDSESTPLLGAVPSASRAVVDRLAALASWRLLQPRPYGRIAPRLPWKHVVTVVHEDAPVSRTSLATVLTHGREVGISVVWLGRRARDLPSECSAVAEVSGERVSVTITDGGARLEGAVEGSSRSVAVEVATRLAPLVDSASQGSDPSLPRRVLLSQTSELPPGASPAAIVERWHRPARGLPVGLGRAAAAARVDIDLVRDGPHALVAGMTGSGKSELLQSLVVSLAVDNPPDRVTFLLVDYKGGATFREVSSLPHCVGLVTDLDDRLARRVLTSMRAELRRREVILDAARTQDLDEMRAAGTAPAPPRLLIVVDEFAALARELPEFVDGIVDLAQRGRSLGLHLVLATQRPAGVITENIRANTNLRICLRVASEADSVDVIGVPDAAHVSRSLPGRGYMRTGHGELTEFQGPHAGAVVDVPDKPVVSPLGFSGRLASEVPTAGGVSERSAFVKTVVHAARSLNLEPARRPWLPDLPHVLPLEDVAGDVLPPGSVALGRLDEPGRQSQPVWGYDLIRDGNLLVYGAAAAGKTGALRTLARALAGREAVADLHMYAIDGGGGLADLEALPHCGSVVPVHDAERVVRLISRLRHEVSERKDNRDPHPRLLLLLDDYGAFASAFEKVDHGEWIEALSRLYVEGRAVGVYAAISAERRAAVPGVVHAAARSRLVLRMGDADELHAAGARGVRQAPNSTPAGRGWIDGVEVQVAFTERVSARDRSPRTDLTAAEGRGGHGPGAIRYLPHELPAGSLPPSTAGRAVALGLRDRDLEPAFIDLAEGHLLVVGPRRSGRSTALATIARALGAGNPDLRAVLMAPRSTPLLDIELWSGAAQGVDECRRLIARLAEDGQRLSANDVLVIDDGEDLVDSDAGGELDVFVRSVARQGVCVLAALEVRAAHRTFAGWVHEMRRNRRGLLLEPDLDLDGELVGVRLHKPLATVHLPGRGFLVEDGLAELVQVAR